MGKLPEVSINNKDNYAKGFGEKFTSDLMEAMGDLRDSVKVNGNDDANVALTNIKGDLDRGYLRKLQDLKNTRDENRKESGDIKAKRIVEVRAQLKSLGIIEDYSMDAKFQKLRESFDRGKVENLTGLHLGATRDAKGEN